MQCTRMGTAECQSGKGGKTHASINLMALRLEPSVQTLEMRLSGGIEKRKLRDRSCANLVFLIHCFDSCVHFPPPARPSLLSQYVWPLRIYRNRVCKPNVSGHHFSATLLPAFKVRNMTSSLNRIFLFSIFFLCQPQMGYAPAEQTQYVPAQYAAQGAFTNEQPMQQQYQYGGAPTQQVQYAVAPQVCVIHEPLLLFRFHPLPQTSPPPIAPLPFHFDLRQCRCST